MDKHTSPMSRGSKPDQRRASQRGAAPLEKEGWMSLQGTLGSGRLVKVSLWADVLALYALKPSARAAPGAVSKAGIPNTASSATITSQAMGHAAGTTIAAAGASASSAGASGASGAANSGTANSGNLPSRVTSPPLGVAHRAVDTQHPDFEEPIVQISCEAVAHRLLFKPIADELFDAYVLCAPVKGVAYSISVYLDLLAAKSLTGAADVPQVARNVHGYCTAVTHFTAIMCNSEALSEVMRAANVLGALDAQLAEQLKMSLAQAKEAAEQQVQRAFALAGSDADVPTAKFDSQIVKLIEEAADAPVKLPAALMLEDGFADELADQIACFHRRLWREWSPIADHSLLFHTPQSSSVYDKNPLVFDAKTPHFLSLLVAQHVLNLRLPLKTRALLAGKWINVAQKLRAQGDGVGWIAVVVALFDSNILRLDVVWDLVPQVIGQDELEDWGLEIFELNKRAALPFLQKRALRAGSQQTGKLFAKQDGVPYFGDAIITDGDVGDVAVTHAQLQRVRIVSNGWAEYVQNVDDEAEPLRTVEHKAFQNLLVVWAQRLPARVDALACSLATKPRVLGAYLPHFRTQQLPLPHGGMIPVLFTSTAPNFRLFPRDTLLLASSPDRDSGYGTSKHTSARLIRRSSSFPPAGQPLITGFHSLDLDAREQLENTASVHVLAKSVRDLLNVGTKNIDGTDIVFKAFADEGKRRGSRTSSIFENLQQRRRESIMIGQDLNRQSTGSSSGAASGVTSGAVSGAVSGAASGASGAASGVSPTGARPLEVVVKSSTIVRLVDALVLDASVFGSRELRLDLDTHIATLLATFRSFCAPVHLLDMLQRRVVCARGAARVLRENQFRPPLASNQLWVASTPADEVDATSVRAISAVINAVEHWVTHYFFDFMDDAAVMRSGMDLIMALRAELQNKTYPESVATRNRYVAKLFLRQKYSICRHETPTEPAWLEFVPGAEAFPAPDLPVTNLDPEHGVPQINAMVDELDTLVADAFSRITMPDWMKLFEVLEQQTVTATGLYSYRTVPYTSEGDVVIQNVFTWLSTLRDPATNTNVIEKLPKPIVALLRLHMGLVSYFTSQIADPALTQAHERVERMEFVLKMLGVLRSRMQHLNSDEKDSVDQNVPSFLEQALTAAVLRPESRVYSAAWLAAAKEVAREFGDDGGSGDSQKLNNLYVPKVPVWGKPVTVCIGWIVERLLEIVCCIPNLTVERPDLINFDKHRYAFNLIQNMALDDPVVVTPAELARKYCYVLRGHPIDARAHRESVARLGRPKHRVFNAIVQQELEKIRAEGKMYNRLERASSAAQAQADASAAGSGSPPVYGLPMSQSSTSLYSKRISRLVPSLSLSEVSSGPSQSSTVISAPTPTAFPAQETSRKSSQRKSRLGGFFKSVRPLSVLGGISGGVIGGSDSSSSSNNNGSSALPGSPPQSSTLYSQKNSSFSSITAVQEESSSQSSASSSPSPWVADSAVDLSSQSLVSQYAEDDFTLISQYDVLDITNVELVPPTLLNLSHRLGNRSETIKLRCSSAESTQDWYSKLLDTIARQYLTTTRVFGVPVGILAQREGTLVPRVLETLLHELEERGLDDVGIYRVSGSVATVNAMKQWFDEGNVGVKPDDPRWKDVNAIAGCVKMYLRELPQVLMTPELLPQFMATVRGINDVDIEELRALLHALPPANYETLKRILHHLQLVIANSDVNKMHMQNISIVFSVNFLPPVEMSKLGTMQHLVTALVEEYDFLFAP